MTSPAPVIYLSDSSGNMTSSGIIILPPMLMSNCLLGIVGLMALISSKTTPMTAIRFLVRCIRVQRSAARGLGYMKDLAWSMTSFFHSSTVRPDDVIDGCCFVKAVVLNHEEGSPPVLIDSFADVRTNISTRHNVIALHYTVVGDDLGIEYIATYDTTSTTLNEMRCPPHTYSWSTEDNDGAADILTASLTVAHSDGRISTHDVSGVLRNHLGPLGDFHRRAGGVITAHSIMPDLGDDIAQSNILYYDGNGTEHSITMPPGGLTEATATTS